MKKFIVLFLFVNVVNASEYVPKEGCVTQNGIPPSSCFNEEYEFYDHELNRLYNLQMQYLQEPNRTRLKEAQRAWIEFRDKDCAYSSGPRSEGGAIWHIEYSGCLTDRTKTRVKELEFYVKCRDNGCPE